MVPNLTGFDFLNHQRLDRFLDLLSVAEIEDWLDHALACGVFGTDPAFARIPVIPEGVEIPLRPRRSRIKGSVAIQLNARNQEMQLDIAHMLVADPENIDLIPLQTREGGSLEIPHHSRLLIIRGTVIRMKGHHAGRVAPFPAVAVDQMASQIRIARKHLRQYSTPDGLPRNALPVRRIGRNFFRKQVFYR